MVIYTASYPPRLIPVSLVLPSLDDGEFAPIPAPGPGPQAAPPSAGRSSILKVSLLLVDPGFECRRQYAIRAATCLRPMQNACCLFWGPGLQKLGAKAFRREVQRAERCLLRCQGRGGNWGTGLGGA